MLNLLPLPSPPRSRSRLLCAILALLAFGALSAAAQNITFAGSFGSKGAGNGQFDYPVDVAVGTDGSIYVADHDNNRVQKFSSSGAFVTKWAHKLPYSLTVDAMNGVYVGTQGTDLFDKYQANGSLIWHSLFPGACAGTFPESLLVAKFTNPLASNPPAYLFVGSVRGVNTFNPGNGHGIQPSVFTRDPSTQCNVTGLAVGPQGQFYLVCQLSNTIQEYDATGQFVRKWGGFGSAQGEFKFNHDYPSRIAVDPDGNVFVADTDNNRIQVFDADGNFLYTFGSAGKGNGQFNRPCGLAINPLSGELYVVDALNYRIQRFLITP
jgi:DNA-binding beta-propeller fold protein YncE